MFHPAYAEAFARLWRPPGASDSWFEYIADRLLPAQSYVSDRLDTEFDRIASILNTANIGGRPVGVVFNAYDLKTGRGVLFGNDHARECLPNEGNLPKVELSADARLKPVNSAGRSLLPSIRLP